MSRQDDSIFYGPPPLIYTPGGALEKPQEAAPPRSWWQRCFAPLIAIHHWQPWFSSSLICGLAGLIPVLGFMSQVGYTLACVETLHLSDGRRFEAFHFNRFGDYLSRGLGPVLVLLLVGVLLSSLSAGTNTALGITLDRTAFFDPISRTYDVDALLNEVARFFIRNSLITYTLLFLLQPMVFALSLRSGLMGNPGELLSLRSAWQIYRRTWLWCWPSTLAYVALATPLLFLGLGACVVGVIPVSGYLTLVNAWLGFRLYRLYLQRGGEPIPLKNELLIAQLA